MSVGLLIPIILIGIALALVGLRYTMFPQGRRRPAKKASIITTPATGTPTAGAHPASVTVSSVTKRRWKEKIKEYLVGASLVIVIVLLILWLVSIVISVIKESKGGTSRENEVNRTFITMEPTLENLKRGEYNNVKKDTLYTYIRGINVGIGCFPRARDFDLRGHVAGSAASWDFAFDENGNMFIQNNRGNPKDGGGTRYTIRFSKDADSVFIR